MFGDAKKYDELKQQNKLVWNVIYENLNARKIEVFNIFEHFGFLAYLVHIKEKLKKQFGKKEEEIQSSKEAFNFFEEEVRSALFRFFGSKSEWEVIITSWPPFVENEEIDRLAEEKEQRIKEWGKFYRTTVNLDICEKVDVFSQVKMNWTQFLDYLWSNLELIKNK